MATTTTKVFHLRPTPPLPLAAAHTGNPASVHLFSSSATSSPSSDPDSNSKSTAEPPPPPQSRNTFSVDSSFRTQPTRLRNQYEIPKNLAGTPQSQSQSAFAAFFGDVKASFRQQSQQPPRNTFSVGSSFRTQPTRLRNQASQDEIRKNLAQYRIRTAPPPPSPFGSISAPLSSPEPISLVNLYNERIAASSGVNPAPDAPQSRSLPFQVIRASLSNIKSKQNQNEKNLGRNEPMSPPYTPDQYTKPSSTVIGGSGSLPTLVVAPERAAALDGDSSAEEMNWEFVKMYNPMELGEKLRSLRPEKKGDNKDWFSLEELNQRLVKLRKMEMDKRRSETSVLGGFLTKSLEKIQLDQTTKKSQVFKFDALGLSGTTTGYMLSPPKEDLIEKYFHPDNLSASEKLKLELNKVRDEFQMSESDCGSARVQVAQLTTRIKHLSGVLHPKDKHSRKGLQAMVERRKKLLKYMRRTDWDSYCFVLSKLGLRDNPGYKH